MSSIKYKCGLILGFILISGILVSSKTIKCNSCEGSECAISVGTLQECEGDENEDACVTVFGSTGNVIAKGCRKKIAEYCSKNKIKCPSNDVVPADRLSCHRCNSIVDPKCQDTPDSSSVCPEDSSNEICATKLVDGVTYRGCSSDFLCDDSDKQYCKLCNTTNCNVVSLYQNNIGYPGKWQDIPINCYTCLDEECDIPSKNVIRKCVNNNEQNCVTVFDTNGKVTQRGCTDTIYSEKYNNHCDRNSELCISCKSSGCNTANKVEDYVNCVFCDSTTDPSCTSNVDAITRTRKCLNGCMTSLYPRSDEDDPAFELTRTCLDDKDLDDRDKCNDKNCKSCVGDKCNQISLPEKRLSCYRCTDECEDSEPALCPAYRENDKCMILFDDDNSIVQMGCKSDFDNSTLTALLKKTIFCDGDDCNSYDIVPSSQKCLVCNSSTDAQCATSPGSLTASSYEYSKLPYTSCYTKIDGALTKRGCLSDLEFEIIDECISKGDNAYCNICKGDMCNIEVYPKNRTTCHRCSSENDINCDSNPMNPSVCPLFQPDDKCVTTISGERTIRSCSSELTCDVENRDTCRICENNNCNSVDLLSNYIGEPGQWQDLPLNCLKCEGKNCKGQLKVCSENNLQKCMTVFDSNGDVIKRGCSDEIAETHQDYCDQNNGKCMSCKSNGCNDVNSLDEYIDCAFCDSATNPNCVLNPNEKIRTRKCKKSCMMALYPRSSEDDPSYELVRTCLDDKDSDDNEICRSDKDQKCKACTESNCNKIDFPAKRHQCYSCRGNSCEEEIKQYCVQYHSADQCYILYDNSSSIVSMGCRSEYEHAAVTGLIQSKSLLLCDGSNCNSFASVPNAQDCVVCNSTADQKCATNPNLVANLKTCSQLPFTGCFTRINEHGDTERGCQSALPNEAFYACHTGSDSVCSTCVGNKCNAEIYPADRLKCHRCNSAEDPNCATSPSSSGVCPKISEGESCVTAYKDGVTYRGCSSELFCDETDRKSCRICRGSACNTIDLEYVAKDGEPGRWQDLPIKCKTCKDNECKNEDSKVETCSNNNVQNCMTVFDNTGAVIERGCSDKVLETQESWCEQNRKNCYRCNSNGCNVAKKQSDFVECVSCDSSLNSACVKDLDSVKNTRMCYKSCMTALFPRSGEDDSALELVRSCLDDKESEDRDECQPGSKNCAACEGSKCNAIRFPAIRRSCYHCSRDNCQSPKSELCSGYKADDECTIIFDDQQEIIEMGCKSDLTSDQSIALTKAKRLFTCDGDDCNTFDALPKSQNCALCNSRTNVECAVGPANMNSQTSCKTLPFTQCYSRVLEDGATERGCLSSLDNDDFYNCLTGNSSSCIACTGEKCNNKIYPEGRKSCHICDSSSDPNCETNPKSLSICHKYDKDDACITSFAAGTTYRDCRSSLQCDSSDRKACRICPSDGCNTIDLARKQDDNYGKWQDLPIECYECSGESCRNGMETVKKCENNNLQDCVVVFDKEGKLVRRGCSDEVDIEYEDFCDKNPGYCFNCKSNKCNSATAREPFKECVFCDSATDKNCVSNPKLSSFKTRQCYNGCMTALFPSDSSSNPGYDMIRTCLDDKEIADQNKCSSNGDPFCKSCTEASCNTVDLPADRLQCHSCNGDSCEDPKSEKCPLYKKDDKCFARFDKSNSIAEMGCLSAFRGQEIIDILKTKRVFICEGKDCNALDKLPQPQKCAICDSASDVNCATNPLQVGKVETCATMPYPNCYTKIASAGTTLRGCLSDLPEDEFANCLISGGENCTHCVGNACNREIFPESRLQCYSCNSDTDPDCESLPTSKSVCPYVRDAEKCVSALGGQRTERGCSSEILCDTTDKSTCRHCSLTDCNTLDLRNRVHDENYGMWQELPLKCHTCTGDQCSNSVGQVVTCQDGDKQDCMTVFDESGKVVRRGCLFEVEDEYDLYCRKNPDNCLVCKSNECNDAWELKDYVECVYCNSAIDSACVTNPTKSHFPTRKCKKGCMAAAFKSTNGTTQIIRTCLDDKELQVQYKCETDETGKDCSSCTEKGCNNFNYPRDRLTCQKCETRDCKSTVAEHCAAYEENDTCYAKYSNHKVNLAGCSSDVDNNVLQEWKKQNEVYSCTGENCNSLDMLPNAQICVSCDSSKNASCATSPNTVGISDTCLPPIVACYSNITNSITYRGCLNKLSYDQQTVCQQTGGTTLCETCSQGSCNSKIYPADRRTCHICKSDADDNCKSEPTKLSVCPKYSPSDECVTVFDKDKGLTERGCSSDISCDVTDADHCRICGKDGCNVDKLDNGTATVIANNLLLMLVVTIVSLMSVKSIQF